MLSLSPLRDIIKMGLRRLESLLKKCFWISYSFSSFLVVLEVNVLLAKLAVQLALQRRHDALDLLDALLDVFDLLLLLLLGFLQQRLRLLDVVVHENLPNQELNLVVVQQLDLLNRLLDVGQIVLLILQILFEILDLCNVVGELVDAHLIVEGDLNVGVGILKFREFA